MYLTWLRSPDKIQKYQICFHISSYQTAYEQRNTDISVIGQYQLMYLSVRLYKVNTQSAVIRYTVTNNLIFNYKMYNGSESDKTSTGTHWSGVMFRLRFNIQNANWNNNLYFSNLPREPPELYHISSAPYFFHTFKSLWKVLLRRKIIFKVIWTTVNSQNC